MGIYNGHFQSFVPLMLIQLVWTLWKIAKIETTTQQLGVPRTPGNVDLESEANLATRCRYSDNQTTNIDHTKIKYTLTISICCGAARFLLFRYTVNIFECNKTNM